MNTYEIQVKGHLMNTIAFKIKASTGEMAKRKLARELKTDMIITGIKRG